MSFIAILDEYGEYGAEPNSMLKAQLRGVDGVPNATYVVRDDGRVFVFDKLVELIRERLASTPDALLPTLALSLMDAAVVTAEDAVKTWNVMPKNYAVTGNAVDGFRIYHQGFHAILPGTFVSKERVEKTLSSLLLGHVQWGPGDFTYRSQSMSLCEPFDLEQLPSRPTFIDLSGISHGGSPLLERVSYEAGFEPISEVMFNTIKERQIAWVHDSVRAARYGQEHCLTLWSLVSENLSVLNDPTDTVPEHGVDEMPLLRAYYPELSMLQDGTLYAWFGAYQSECCYVTGWTSNRDEVFLSYLIGKVAGRHYTQEKAVQVGQWVLYALSQGYTFNDACKFSRDVSAYNDAITNLAVRVSEAMRCIAEDRSSLGLQGPPVITLMDAALAARSISITKPAAQNMEHINSNVTC